MDELENKIGYTFVNKALLTLALTHSSYGRERHEEYNERLEFLGDSILGATAAERIFRSYPEMPEGEMTRLRAELVCEKSLGRTADALGMGRFLRLGKGEEQNGGRTRRSILADSVEALIAAIYLDGGRARAISFIESFVLTDMDGARSRLSDSKTALQELVQRRAGAQLSYELLSEDGPDHSKTFTMAVLIDGAQAGTGRGRSKKEAEQAAAASALESLK